MPSFTERKIVRRHQDGKGGFFFTYDCGHEQLVTRKTYWLHEEDGSLYTRPIQSFACIQCGPQPKETP